MPVFSAYFSARAVPPAACHQNHTASMPEWFLNGMEAVLLAPTAMNQQKFFITYVSDSKINASCGKGFYTKLDLGIVTYHFEMGSGKKINS